MQAFYFSTVDASSKILHSEHLTLPIFPDSTLSFWLKRGTSLLKTANYPDAIKDLSQCLRLEPTNKEASVLIGQVHAKLGR